MKVVDFAVAVLVFGSLLSPAYATVIEFGEDGSVIVHEAKAVHERIREKKIESVLLREPTHKNQFDTIVLSVAQKYGVDADLVHAVIAAESSRNPNAVSPKGAGGLMQLMPGTAEQYGVSDVFSPEENIEGGTKYLRFLLDRYDGDTDLVLAAYNSGEGTVDRYGDVPPYPETKAYVARVSAYLNKIQTKEREDERK